MIRKEPKGYEVAEYSDVDFGITEAHKVIYQIFQDIVRDCPTHAISGDITGDKLRIRYMTVCMFLPTRIKEVEAEAEGVFKEMISHLKKEFRSRTGKVLKLKEQKDLGNRAIEKISLNERYYAKFWKFFELDWS